MNHSLATTSGMVLIRGAKPTDAAPFRELRLYALQDTPVAFTADYQRNLVQPPQDWEAMLTMHADESTIFLVNMKIS